MKVAPNYLLTHFTQLSTKRIVDLEPYTATVRLMLAHVHLHPVKLVHTVLEGEPRCPYHSKIRILVQQELPKGSKRSKNHPDAPSATKAKLQEAQPSQGGDKLSHEA